MIDGEIMQVEPENLVTEVLMLKHRDYRIIQICAAKAGDRIEITYSFGKEYKDQHTARYGNCEHQ